MSPVPGAADRIARLQAVTAALSGALTSAQVAGVVVEQGVAALGARAGSVALLTGDGAELETVRTVGYPEALVRPWRRFPLDARTPLTDAVRSGEPVFLESRDAWRSRYPQIGEIEDDPGEAWAAIPLLADGRAIGGLALTFPEARAFSNDASTFILTLARQCALALERARLYEAERKRRADLEFLSAATRTLSASLDYETTLSGMAGLTVPDLADWCAVDVADAEGAVRRIAVAHVDPAKVEWARDLQRRYPSDPEAPRGVPNVLRTGRSELYPDISEEMLAAAARDAEQAELLRTVGFRSALIVPLTARGRTLGAITFVTTDESGRRYGPDDLAFAEELARRAALAVDNARLYAEAQEAARLHRDGEARLALLAQASGALLQNVSLDAVLPAVLELSTQLIQADAYAVWRMAPGSDTWQVVCDAGLSEAYRAAHLVSGGQGQPRLDAPLPIEDVERDERLATRREAYREEGIGALLILPITIQAQNTGTLVFYYREPHRFSQTDLRVGTALANLAGSAIGTAELYAEQKQAEAALREETEIVETVSRIGQMLSAELDLHKLVQAVTDAATEISGAQFGAFFYNVTEGAETYTLYTISGVAREKFSRFPMPRNTDIFAPTFRGDGVVRIDDVTKDPRYGRNAPYHGMPAGHLPVASYLAVPVCSRSGGVLGGLFLGHEKPGVFTERVERTVLGLAAQAAVAMDNARLFAEAQREIEERKRAETALRDGELRTRTFLRDVLASVTEGKLRLCDSADDLPPRLPSAREPIRLAEESLRALRLWTQDVAREQGFDKDRGHDLLTAVGEASMNAVRHAGGGTAWVGAGTDPAAGTVQVWVEDRGTGITMERLPRATLERGFSYAGTLGHGFWLILNTIDRMYLLTGPGGTTVVVEQDRVAPEPAWFAGR